MDTAKISAKWLIINVSTRSYMAQRKGSDLPPVTIRLEAPLSDQKLKRIAAYKNNLSKINEMPADVLEDLWKASVI